MKILLLGKNGQIGWELQRALAPQGNVIALGREDLDLTDEAAIRQTVREIKPKLIVNAAAYNLVDQAEKEPELAMSINGTAPGILAEEVAKIRGAIIHYSTDYVFDGNKHLPYTEDDIPNPINAYGKSKLAGEMAILKSGSPFLILRTSWVYGLRGKNFLLTIMKLAHEQKNLRIVNDQIGIPNWSRMIAEVTAQILAQGEVVFSEKKGLYHISAEGHASWFSFATEIVSLIARSGLRLSKIEPITSYEYRTAALRPSYSVLSSEKLKRQFGLSLPEWRSTLMMALQDLEEGRNKTFEKVFNRTF